MLKFYCIVLIIFTSSLSAMELEDPNHTVKQERLEEEIKNTFEPKNLEQACCDFIEDSDRIYHCSEKIFNPQAIFDLLSGRFGAHCSELIIKRMPYSIMRKYSTAFSASLLKKNIWCNNEVDKAIKISIAEHFPISCIKRIRSCLYDNECNMILDQLSDRNQEIPREVRKIMYQRLLISTCKENKKQELAHKIIDDLILTLHDKWDLMQYVYPFCTLEIFQCILAQGPISKNYVHCFLQLWTKVKYQPSCIQSIMEGTFFDEKMLAHRNADTIKNAIVESWTPEQNSEHFSFNKTIQYELYRTQYEKLIDLEHVIERLGTSFWDGMYTSQSEYLKSYVNSIIWLISEHRHYRDCNIIQLLLETSDEKVFNALLTVSETFKNCLQSSTLLISPEDVTYFIQALENITMLIDLCEKTYIEIWNNDQTMIFEEIVAVLSLMKQRILKELEIWESSTSDIMMID